MSIESLQYLPRFYKSNFYHSCCRSDNAFMYTYNMINYIYVCIQMVIIIIGNLQ